jgi:hypothetical protein
MGAVAWTPVEPSNDIEKVLREHGDRITVVGGYDFQGPPGLGDAPEELVRSEVRRAIDTYAPLGSYVFLGSMLVSGQNLEQRMAKMMGIIQEAARVRARLLREQGGCRGVIDRALMSITAHQDRSSRSSPASRGRLPSSGSGAPPGAASAKPRV